MRTPKHIISLKQKKRHHRLTEAQYKQLRDFERSRQQERLKLQAQKTQFVEGYYRRKAKKWQSKKRN